MPLTGQSFLWLEAPWPWYPLIERICLLLSWQASWIHAANSVCLWGKQTHRLRGTSSSPWSWFPWTPQESMSSGLCQCMGWRMLQVRSPRVSHSEYGSSPWAAVLGSPCSVQKFLHTEDLMALVIFIYTKGGTSHLFPKVHELPSRLPVCVYACLSSSNLRR